MLAAADPQPVIFLCSGIKVKVLCVSAAHDVTLGGKNPGQHNAAAGLAQGAQLRMQLDQRAGKDVGQYQVTLQVAGDVFGQHAGEAVSDAVGCGVVLCCQQRLRVDVAGPGVACAEQQRGNGQYAGAAAEIHYLLVLQVGAVEPLEAQGGGFVGAGAERQARIKTQVDRICVRRLAPARHDPQ